MHFYDSNTSKLIGDTTMSTSFVGEFRLPRADKSDGASEKDIDTDSTGTGDLTCPRPRDSLDRLDPIWWKHLSQNQPAVRGPIAKSRYKKLDDKKCEDDEIGMICNGKIAKTHVHSSSSSCSSCEDDEVGLIFEKDFKTLKPDKSKSRHRKVSQREKSKPKARKKMPPPCKQLFDWAVIPDQNRIQIEGRLGGDDSSFQLCRTNHIVSVSSCGMKVCTSSGSTYQLNGDMLLSASMHAGIPFDIADKFIKGFPKDWKRYLHLDILFQSWTKDVSAAPENANSQLSERSRFEPQEDTTLIASHPSLIEVNTEPKTVKAVDLDSTVVISNSAKDQKHDADSDEKSVVETGKKGTRKKISSLPTSTRVSKIVKKHDHKICNQGKVSRKFQEAVQKPHVKLDHVPVKQTRSGRNVILPAPYKLNQTCITLNSDKESRSCRTKPKTRKKTIVSRITSEGFAQSSHFKNEEYLPVKQTKSGRNVTMPYKLNQSYMTPKVNERSRSCKAPKKSKKAKELDEMKSAKRLCVVDLGVKLTDSMIASFKSSSKTKSPELPRKSRKKPQSKSSKKIKVSRKAASSARLKKNSQHADCEDEPVLHHATKQQKDSVVLTPLRRSRCINIIRQSQTVEGAIADVGAKQNISCDVSQCSRSTGTWSTYKKGQLRKLVNADISWSDISARLKASSEECMEVYQNMKTRKRTKTKTDKDKELNEASVAKIPRKGTLKHRQEMRQYFDNIMKKPDKQKQDIFHGDANDSSTRNFFKEMCDKDNFVPVTPSCKAPWLEDSCTTPAWFKTPTGQPDWAMALDTETPVTSKETWYQRVNAGNDEVKRKEADKIILQLGKKMAQVVLPLSGRNKNHEITRKNNEVDMSGISANLRAITESVISADADHDESGNDEYFELDKE